MGKRLNRSKKLIAFLFVFVFALSVGMYSTSFDSKAANLEFYLDYPEPSKEAFNGYICLLYQDNSTGKYHIATYFWNVFVLNDPNALSAAYASIYLEPNLFRFTVSGNITGQNMSAMYNLHGIHSDGYYRLLKHSSSESHTINFTGITIKGFKYNGPCDVQYKNIDIAATPFSIYFGSSATYSVLIDILSSINSLEIGDNSTLHEDLSDLINSVDDVESQLNLIVSYLRNNLTSIDSNLSALLDKADSILNEQKVTNNWLQKIWQAIVDFFTPNQDDEDKKNELDDEYQSQVDDLEDLDEGLELDKPPPEEVEEEIEDNLDVVEDEEDLEEFKDILSLILNNEYIIEMLLIVLTLILIAFVFYGKR